MTEYRKNMYMRGRTMLEKDRDDSTRAAAKAGRYINNDYHPDDRLDNDADPDHWGAHLYEMISKEEVNRPK